MTNHYFIGVVVETTASELKDSDVLVYKNDLKNIAYLKREGNRTKIGFDYLRPDNWELSLTNRSKVYILGTKRVTGMKEKEGEL